MPDQSSLGASWALSFPRSQRPKFSAHLLFSQETLAELMLRLQLMRREKRGLELKEAALRAQGPAHVLLLEQLRWEQAQLRTGGANSSGGDSSGGGSSGDEEESSQVSGPSWTWWG